MPNIPEDLRIPSSAVAPAQRLVVQTRAWDGEGGRREAGSWPVLAIAWYPDDDGAAPERFVYLVFDRMTHEIFWVAQSLVERVVSG